MSDQLAFDAQTDPTTAPFWEAARRQELVVQRCLSCNVHQFYPRPVCLACFGIDLQWVAVSGFGVVYSQTTVRVNVVPDLPAPYVVGVVELDEGVRMTTNLVGKPCRIGDRVRVRWRQREGKPPLPVFEPIELGQPGGEPKLKQESSMPDEHRRKRS